MEEKEKKELIEQKIKIAKEHQKKWLKIKNNYYFNFNFNWINNFINYCK
ncbi:hypothetical protein [Spiroplasma endosymbiont of Amphimallon solstitiale]